MKFGPVLCSLALCVLLARVAADGGPPPPTTTAAPTSTAPPTTSAEPTTTAAPTSTAMPTTSVAPTSSVGPTATENEVPTSTEALVSMEDQPVVIMMNQQQDEGAREPYIRERGNIVYLYVPTRMTFAQAASYCTGLSSGNSLSNYSSYLASVHSVRENFAIAKWAYHLRPASYMWIGTKRIHSNAKPMALRFGNEDGSPFDIAAKFTPLGARKDGGKCPKKRSCLFMDYQPSETRLGHQDCVAMKIGGDEYSRWNDIPCMRQLPFVCKLTLMGELNNA